MSKGERRSKTKLRRKQACYEIENNISDRGSKGMKSFLFYRYVSLNDKGGYFWHY
jgi:hypothetical protein